MHHECKIILPSLHYKTFVATMIEYNVPLQDHVSRYTFVLKMIMQSYFYNRLGFLFIHFHMSSEKYNIISYDLIVNPVDLRVLSNIRIS